MYAVWRNLIKPKRVEMDESTLSEIYGKFEARPLERGYGITLGSKDSGTTRHHPGAGAAEARHDRPRRGGGS